MAAPNQRIAQVHKELTDDKHIYAKINNEALCKAALALNGSTFKLWIYFAKNQDNYQFELSAVAVKNYCGISDKTYRESVKELISKGYLVQRCKNYYDFYEVPRAVEVPADGSIITCHTSTIFEKF